MARTTPERMKAVLLPGKDYDLARSPSLDEFILIASSKIDQLVVDCGVYEITVPAGSVLAALETWIAAWAYKNSDQQHASMSARSFASYKGLTGKGLESNHYGQTAIELDPTGLLQTKERGAVVGAAWSGRRLSEQTDYIDRN